jgi:hypothetical protein
VYDRDGRWIAVRCYQRGAVDQHIDVFVVSLNPDDNPFARTPQLDPITRPQHQIIFRSAKYKTVVGRMLAIGPDSVCPVMVGNIGQNDFSSGVGRITNRTEFRAGTSWLKSTTSALESGVMGRSRLATTVMSASRNTFLLFRTMSTIALAKSGLYDDWKPNSSNRTIGRPVFPRRKVWEI